MQKFSYFLLLFAIAPLFLTSSCKKDDCTAPALEQNIVGSWTLITSTVEFRANGQLLDPDGVLIDGEINGTVLDEKSYVVNGEDSFTVRAESGTQFVEFEYTVASNECDVITLSALGFQVEMSRK